MKKKSLKEQEKLYEKLGALKFQKVVFKVEEIKFKIIKKLFPNFIKYFDKYCDFKQKQALKRAKTDKEKEKIKRNVKFSKLAMRKELNFERNRNYHIDKNKPTEIMRYLEWNKSVHKKGLIKDGIVIPILIAGVVLQIPGALAILIFELLSAVINFECVNIQNYNICRIKRIEPRLKKIEERRVGEQIEKYGEAAEVIHKSIEQSESLPSFDEILDNIDNVEQLKQMRALFQSAIEERKKQKLGGK